MTDPLTLPAGPELDRAVALSMGLSVYVSPMGYRCYRPNPNARPESNINSRPLPFYSTHDDGLVEMLCFLGKHKSDIHTFGGTLPEILFAVCRAVLTVGQWLNEVGATK